MASKYSGQKVTRMNDPQYDKQTPNTPTPPPRSVLNDQRLAPPPPPSPVYDDRYHAAPPPAPEDDDLYDNPYAAAPPRDYDYYDFDGSKWGDFLLGFFGVLVIDIAAFFLCRALTKATFPEFFILPILVLDATVVAYAFKFKRRYIGIGIIAILILPLLLMGACAVWVSATFLSNNGS